jgi:hypothetical protein
MRAVLLARATETRRAGLRLSSLAAQFLLGLFLSRSTDHRRGADNEQSPNIAIAALTYTDKFFLAAAAM